MKAYIVGNYTVNDEKKYLEYIKNVGGVVSKYKGRTIIADHGFKTMEGKPNQVIVVVEFNSGKEANDFYNSKEYQDIIDYRKNSTQGWVAIANEFIMT